MAAAALLLAAADQRVRQRQHGARARGALPDALRPHRRIASLLHPVVIFYVDGVAVREVPRSGGDYPSKPMALYATIWDGSTWATDNGRYKVNYKRGPFTAHFSDLVLRGCPAAPHLQLQLQMTADESAGAEFELMTAEYAIMTARKRMEMRQMLYTVCYDTNRYPAPFPECDVNMAERQKFWESKVVRPRVRPQSGRRRPATTTPQLVSLQQAD